MMKPNQNPTVGRASMQPMAMVKPLASSQRKEAKLKKAGGQKAPPKKNYLKPILIGLFTVALLAGAGGYYYSQNHVPQPQPAALTPAPVPVSGYITNAQLESQYGMRVTLIAVTAMNGIVDFRYKITDMQKAMTLLHNNDPVLTAIDSGLKLMPTKMGSRHHAQMGMKTGSVPFTFYPNVRNAVKPGTQVSVSFGEVHVEPIAAQ